MLTRSRPFHNVYLDICLREQISFIFFMRLRVCVLHSVKVTQVCIFFPVYHSHVSKKKKPTNKPTPLCVVMLWWVGGVIENASYHFCRGLISNDFVPCIIYCLRLLLIHDWFGNKQSCHHFHVALNSLKRPLWLPAVQRWHIFEPRGRSVSKVSKVTQMTLPFGWTQDLCKWHRSRQWLRKSHHTEESSNLLIP